jgi:hypothetical protein
MPASARDSIEGCGELAGPISHADPNCVMRSPRSITRLRTCCVVHRPSGSVDAPSRCTRPAGDLQHEQHVDPMERHGAVYVEQVAGQHGCCLRAAETVARSCPISQVSNADRLLAPRTPSKRKAVSHEISLLVRTPQIHARAREQPIIIERLDGQLSRPGGVARPVLEVSKRYSSSMRGAAQQCLNHQRLGVQQR